MKEKFANLEFLLMFLFLTLLIQIGCRGRTPDIHWNYSNKEVIRETVLVPDSIRIDIYLDATTSMLGFANNSTSIYNKFLEELETTASVGWRTADIRFFKFGTRIREIDRDTFRASRHRGEFYNEPGIFERTNIDSVINQTDSSRVSVVITDLFQDKGNVNSIVLQIKDRCFKQGIQVALLGIKSEFDGWVYDVNQPYKLETEEGDTDTYRPFYALMFGDPMNIERLFTNLKLRSFVEEENFLVLSRFIMNEVNINLTKSRDCRSLLNISRRPEEPEYLFKFVLKKENDEGTLDADISFERNTRTPDFQVEKIELIAYKKVSQQNREESLEDSVLTNDIVLNKNKITRDGNKLQATFDLKLSDPQRSYPPGKYSYMVYLQWASIDTEGLSVPQWVRNYSSENPSAQNDANRTLNLEKFINDLIRANLTIYQPKIAKLYLTIEKL